MSMKDLRLLQIIPSLESGGAEQATIDVANYVNELGFNSIVISNGGRMMTHLKKNNLHTHVTLPVDSKNPLVMFKNINNIKKIILKNNINLVHVRSRAPAWTVYYACKNLCRTVSTFHNVYGHQNTFKNTNDLTRKYCYTLLLSIIFE